MNTQNAVIEAPAIVGDKQANAVEVPVTKGKRATKVKTLPSVVVSMGLIETAIRSNKAMPEGVNPSDMSSFMADRIQGSNTALRDAVLAASASCRMGQVFETVVKEKLMAVFPVGSTVANIFSCGRNIVPALQSKGVDVLAIPNLYGMRELSKAIGDKDHASHKAVIAGIKKGDSLGKLKSLVPKVEKGAKVEVKEEKKSVSAPVEGIQFTDEPSQKEQLRRAFDLVSKLMRELPVKVSQEIAAKHLVGYTIAHKSEAKTK